MSKKIGPIPLPIAIALVAVVGYLAYRRFKSSSSSTPATTSGSTGVDPNAASNDAGMGAGLGNTSTGTGTGDGGAGGGISLSDVEGLISAMQGLQPGTVYNYGVQPGSGTQFGGTGTADATTGGSSGATGGSGLLQFAPVTGAPGSALASIQKLEGYGTTTKASPQQIVDTQQKAQNYLSAISAGQSLGVSTTNVPTAAPKPFNYSSIPNPTITANKTGGSANKTQGIYAIH
jgi:hypothetical protein